MRQPSLPRPTHFARAFDKGRRARRGPITLYSLPRSPSEAPTRLGLVVPRSCGGAVTRNRIKRRLRHAFEASRPPRGLDVVIRGGPDAATLEFEELVATVRDALQEAEGA